MALLDHSRRSPASGPPSRRRRTIARLLIVLAALVAFVSTLVLWVNRQVVADQGWRTTSTAAVQSPAVRAAVATAVVDALYTNVDPQKLLEERLPGNLKRLAGPLSGALRQPAASAVEAALTRPRVQQLWLGATARAHAQLIDVLENKTGHGISTGNGVVTIDLGTLVREVGTELGLPANVLAKVPADAGKVTVMRSSQLNAAQKGYRILRIASPWLIVLAVALVVLAIDIVPGARREALRMTGWAIFVVGVLVLILRRALGNYVIGAVAPESYRPVGHEVWAIGTSMLRDIGWACVFYGAVTVAAAVLVGPTAAALAVRRRLDPTLVNRPEITWGGAAVLYLLVVLWGPTYALRTGWGILLFAALLAVGIVALRRVAARDLVDAGAVVATPGDLDRAKPLPLS